MTAIPVNQEELIENLPRLVELAISYILDDFDYAVNMEANTAVAVMILATAVDRLGEVHS